MASAGGVYEVDTLGGLVYALLRGRLKLEARKGDKVVVGDIVELAPESGGRYTIERVARRRTRLVRRSLEGRQYKIVAANLHRQIVVAAAADPPPVPEVIDRMAVMGEAGGLEVRLVLNKVDLSQGLQAVRTIGKEYRAAGYPVLFTSTVNQTGIAELARLLGTRHSVLTGPSGVGKSSLLNQIDPSLDLRTAPVGARSRAGRHVTVSSRLIPLAGGGYVADTPGFTDVGLAGISADALADHFIEFREHARACRFRNCLHRREPGCEVRQNVASGKISIRRYRSYRTMLRELES